MTVTDPTLNADDPRLAAEIARVRASGALGTAGRLLELFDFLAARSSAGRAPKEAEIAFEVFGKADADATRDDPVARVYIHRLRKRLDEFYLRNGMADGVRLDIPRGEYRIMGVDASAAPAGVETAERGEAADPLTGAGPSPAQPNGQPRRRMWAWVGAAAALLLAVNVGAWAMFSRTGGAAAADDIRQAAAWKPLAQSQRALTVVVGDYYIFGEYEDRVFLKRLVRDFSINNKEDLMAHAMTDPQGFDRFGDVALQYLPTSAAYAMADIAPVLQGRQVRVVLASQLQPETLKSDDIIYVGWLSGLGPLRNPTFAGSRFSVGESYDQIVDRREGVTYTSETFLAAPSDAMYRDYALFSAYRGPSGNRIVVLAGARDTALMGLAEAVTRAGSLKDLAAQAGGSDEFEAMFEVKGQKHVNLEARVLSAGPLKVESIWTGTRGEAIQFPEQ